MLEAKVINALIYVLITVAAFFNASLFANNNKSFIENAATILAHSFQKVENPCNASITYTIGTFDDRFGISKEEFRKTIDDATKEWNRAASKELFAYTPNGSMKINLVYDARQEDAQKLQQMDPGIDKMEASLKALDQEFQIKKKQYDEHKLRIAVLKNDEELYKKELAILETEKIAVKKIIAKRDLLYKKYEDSVDYYNILSVSRRGEDYEVGRYYTSNNRKQLDVYEFQDSQDLERLLMHEFGHALGLDHTSSIKDVMYELNKSTNIHLTMNDIRELKQRCGEQ